MGTFASVGCGLVLMASNSFGQFQYRQWSVYGGGPDSIRYSELSQIARTNVHQLEVAWTHDTGDAFQDSEMQCNPIVVDGTLYATTPKLRVIALDAASGRLRWSFDPWTGQRAQGRKRNRGVSYWASGADRRIFVVAGHDLVALDASTGAPIRAFGLDGRVDLREGLGREPARVSITATTPGIVYQDLLILGSLMSEDLPSPPGDIRAYDVRTGKLRWSFHTIPRPGEFGFDTWPPQAWQSSGAANNWAGMSLDEKRGMVFAPTGSAAFDFYGADRAGDNLFANCLLALDARTGKRIWHFQAVRHDVWDRDLPSPPNLVTVRRSGRQIDAVAQPTKSGHLFLFERETGKPLFPIENRAVPASDVDGELLSGTQPLPLQPPPFARQLFNEDLVTRRTPEAHQAVLERLRRLRSGGQFMPPSREGTVIFPGYDGGAEWGGGAFDPRTGLFYINSNEMAWVLRLVERRQAISRTTASELYRDYCASCHRPDLSGSPPEFPSLLLARNRMKESEIADSIRSGHGRMPAYAVLGEEAIGPLARYVRSGEDGPAAASGATPRLKYTTDGYNKFLDPEGYPAVTPPWGTLTAINLNTGKIVWRVPLGEFPELAAKGFRDTGSENYGGPLVTSGGLVFIGATIHDRKFRAFDKRTGKLLWETTLPAAGNATPATYEVAGRQFVVIAAGGGKWGARSGGSYVAFALPATRPDSGRRARSPR